MSKLYIPNFTKALPRPRITPPKADIGAAIASGALNAAQSVASNWREQRRAVKQAKSMADALEAEGMTEEAAMYRAAAESFEVNFFADPSANQKFRDGVLNDAIQLIKAKQTREYREQQAALRQQQLSQQQEYQGARLDQYQQAIDQRNQPKGITPSGKASFLNQLYDSVESQVVLANKAVEGVSAATHMDTPESEDQVLGAFSSVYQNAKSAREAHLSAAKQNLEKAHAMADELGVPRREISGFAQMPTLAHNRSFSSARAVARDFNKIPEDQRKNYRLERSASGIWEIKDISRQPTVSETTTTNAVGDVTTSRTITGKGEPAPAKKEGNFLNKAPGMNKSLF